MRDRAEQHRLALFERRRQRGVLGLRRLELEIAARADADALGAEDELIPAVGDVGRGPLQHGRGHLAGDGTVVDESVEPVLLGAEELADALRRAGEVGGAERLVRFLPVLRASPGDGVLVGP